MTTSTPTSRARDAVLARAAAPAGGNGSNSRGQVAGRATTLEDKIRDMRDQFELALPRGVEAAQLVRDGLTALKQVPDLAKCDHATVLGGLMRCAQLGLRPGPMEWVHLIPFRNGQRGGQLEAQVVIDYKGYIHLAHNAGTTVNAEVIYSKDVFRRTLGFGRELIHEPPPFGEDRGDVIGYYATAEWANGGRAFYAMTLAEVERHRDLYSKSFKQNPRKSTWTTNPHDMGMKTCIRQLRKRMPMSIEMAQAFSADGSVTRDVDVEALQLGIHPDDVVDGEVENRRDEPARETATDPTPEPTAPAPDLMGRLRSSVDAAGKSASDNLAAGSPTAEQAGRRFDHSLWEALPHSVRTVLAQEPNWTDQGQVNGFELALEEAWDNPTALPEFLAGVPLAQDPADAAAARQALAGGGWPGDAKPAARGRSTKGGAA